MRPRSVAWIAEDVELGDGDPCDEWCTATFSAHVESDAQEAGVSHEFADLRRALDWALARAEIAHVRFGDDDTEYWHGPAAPPKSFGWVPLDRFEIVPRRPPGRQWCDRSDRDPVVEWPVTVTVLADTEPPSSRALKTRLRTALLALDVPSIGRRRLGRVDRYAAVSPESPLARVHLLVHASDRFSAAEIAERACLACAGELAPDRHLTLRAEVWTYPPNLSESDGGPDWFTKHRMAPAPRI